METYSRDVMGNALRHLDTVIKQIRDKSFFPDVTRSGVFAKPRPPPSSTSSSSRSPSSTPCSDDAIVTDAEPEQPEHEVALNVATGCYHLAKDTDYLVCGKAFPDKARRLQAPPPGARLCARCW